MIEKNFFNNKIVVNKPLSYLAMTKSTKSLREKHQEDIRSLSLQYENIIKNRRFAVVYLLAKCSKQDKNLNFERTINELKKFPKLFVIDLEEFDRIMYVELNITSVSGLPYKLGEKKLLQPLTYINMNELCKGAPNSLIQTLDDIYPKLGE